MLPCVSMLLTLQISGSALVYGEPGGHTFSFSLSARQYRVHGPPLARAPNAMSNLPSAALVKFNVS